MMLRSFLATPLLLVLGCSSAATAGDATTAGDGGIDVGAVAIDAYCNGPCGCMDVFVICDDAGSDSGSSNDSGSSGDAGTATDSGTSIDTSSSIDSGDVDATTFCDPTTGGTCSGGLSCDCCPAGGVLERCICSTPCTSDAECTDPSRPICQRAPGSNGFCAPASLVCCWLCG